MPTISPFPRIGTGYDVHPFAEGRRLVLGGVEIPHDRGLAGHSDADVLLHALTDAVLGALALGDIGVHFPPTEEQWRDIESMRMLAHAHGLISLRGWRVGNVDATVIAEVPQVNPHVAGMRGNIASCLHIPDADISIKATTNEGLGFVGREEGIAAIAVALLIPDTHEEAP